MSRARLTFLAPLAVLVFLPLVSVDAVERTSERASSPSQTPSELQGTAWRLVQFQGGDDTTLTPLDPSKYTIEFLAGGQLAARIDCNRGRGTWKSSGPNQVEFGPLALTRAMCPKGSLHDRIVKHWSSIRSYVFKDGHLFLSLMADGGSYEFEPLPKPGSDPKSGSDPRPAAY